jgi:nicotinamidase-related amidase
LVDAGEQQSFFGALVQAAKEVVDDVVHTEVKVEVRHEPKHEPKREPTPEPQHEPKSEPKAEVKKALKPEERVQGYNITVITGLLSTFQRLNCLVRVLCCVA